MNIDKAKDEVNTHTKDLIDLCPHCGARSHIEKLWHDYHRFRNGDIEFYIVFRCKPCKKLVLKTLEFEQNKYSDNEKLRLIGWKEKFPITLDDQLSNEEKEFVDNQVLSDYQEALKCKSIGAYRASCSMFRRSLQSSLLVLGANHKLDLIKQIESLDNLPADIKDWSHQIRIFGNWGAHPDADNLKNVDGDDVSEAHDFVSKFLTYMFIMPEKVKLSRERRQEKIEANDKQNQEAEGSGE